MISGFTEVKPGSTGLPDVKPDGCQRCVGDNRAKNGLHGGQTFKGPVRHKGVPVKAQLVSNSTVSS